MQNEGEANLSTEPLGVGGEGEQGVRGGAKEQPEELAAVGEDDRAQDRWQSEDAVEVRGVEETLLASLDPAMLGGPLTGGAVAVQAGVEQRHVTAAILAAVGMNAERGGAAAFEVVEYPRGFGAQGVSLAERGGEAAEDLGDRELCTRGRVHVHLRFDLRRNGVEGGSGLGDGGGADVDVAHGGADVGVAEECLDDAQVGAGLEAVGGKRMAQGLGGAVVRS